MSIDRLKKLIGITIIIGTIGLIYYQPITDEGVITRESVRFRSEFAFLAAIILAGTYGIIILPFRRMKAERIVNLNFALLFLFIVSCLFSTYISLMVYGWDFNRTGKVTLIKDALGLLLSYVVYLYLVDNPKFFKLLYYSILLVSIITSLPLILAVVAPGMAFIMGHIINRDLMSERYIGLQSNPNQVAVQALTGLSLSWAMSLYNFSRRHWTLMFANLLLIFAFLFSLFATVARAALLCLIPLFLFETIVFCKTVDYGFLKRAPVLFLLSLVFLVMAGSFLAMPSDLKDLMVSRLREDNSARTFIWSYYLNMAANNPLGLGVNYEEEIGLPNTIINSKRPRLPTHNAFLEAWIRGGLIGAFTIILFILLNIKTISFKLKYLKHNQDAVVLYIGVITSLLGYWIMALFISLPFSDYGYMILFAMSMAGIRNMREGTGCFARGEIMSSTPCRVSSDTSTCSLPLNRVH